MNDKELIAKLQEASNWRFNMGHQALLIAAADRIAQLTAGTDDWRLDGPLYHFWGDGDGDFVNTSLIVDANRNPIIEPYPIGVPVTKGDYEHWQRRVEAGLADAMLWRAGRLSIIETEKQ